jgi:ribonuclease P protein component
MTGKDGEGFPKAARIRRRREFLSFGRTGGKRRTAHFVLLTERSGQRPRLGITVSRKVGGAVERNRLKRRIREIYRRDPERCRLDRDLIVIARPGAGTLSIDALRRELSESLHPRAATLGPRPTDS